MPAKNVGVFSNKDTRTWVQPSGPGTDFVLYGCQALTNWARGYGDPTYIKCKSPNEYGVKEIKETIPGDPDQPTFTVTAFTSREADFLLSIDCKVDFQVFYGSCTSPSDRNGYVKIRHFYRASKTNESEDNVDFIGDEDYTAIQLSAEFSAEDVIEILKCTVVSSAAGSTEAQAFNDVAFLADARCEGSCGAEIKACYWGVAVADANYAAATANVWRTTDGGATWVVCATDPFASNGANISSCVILPGEVAPRIIVFQGTVNVAYGARASVSDDWGATWAEVDMGGDVNGSYVNGATAYSAGLIMAVGNGGHYYYSEDRGTNWTVVTGATTGTVVELWDVHTPDGMTIYICGDGNVVRKSTDGGVSWATTTTLPADATENLLTIQAPTEYRVVCGGNVDGNGECLWVSVDGGTTWAAMAFNGSTTASGQVRRVRVARKAPEQHMVMLHGVNNGATMRYGPGTNFYFFRTLDGGSSWERQNLVTNSGLNGLSVCGINKAFGVGEPVSALGVIQKMSD